MKARAAGPQRGFSLIELLVAMVVTMIVSGAIYGLLASGQTAFRREPELADRQQNIRVAMDLISRDILNAGAGLPAGAQIFTIQDPGSPGLLNGLGAAGSLGSTAAAARNSDPSSNSDVLEILSTEERCPSLTVCPGAPSPGTAGTFVTMERAPSCMSDIVVLTDNTNFTVQPLSSPPPTPPAPSLCLGAVAPADNGNIPLLAAPSPWNSPSPFTSTTFLYSGRLVRYRIAPSTDPNDPAPSLWRSATGRFGTVGAAASPLPEPGAGGFPAANSNWQLVARGIEELQVEYLDGSGTWRNSPRPAVATDPTTIVRNVRVTLAARTTAPNLLGATRAGAGASVAPDAIRGSLVSVITPRAAIVQLQMSETQQ